VSKYKNVKTDGYASRAEARRAAELKLLERAGKITELQEQVRWKILPSQDGERPVFYVVDFQFRDENGELHLQDVKGVRTPVFILKRKMMQFVHGIKIEEVAA
jgi:hypothetical protein